MEFLITNQEIEATNAFQTIDKSVRSMVLKLSSKKIISNGLLVYRATNVIPGSVSGYNLKVLKDIIDNEKSHS